MALKTILIASALVFGANVETSEVVSDPISTEPEITETITTEITTTEQTTGEVEEEVKSKFEEFLSKYLDKNAVANIINWCIDAGLISALAVLLLKYRKFKSKTIEEIVNEVKTALEKYLKECFNQLSQEQIDGIKNAINDGASVIDNLKKVIYLLNSKDANDKLTALEILAQNTKTTEEKEKIYFVKEQIVKEQEQKQETLKKVEGEYISVD